MSSIRGTVFVVSSVHWHFTWQRHQEFSTGLAGAGFEVVFIEPLPKRWPGPREWSRVWGRLMGRPEAAGGIRQPDPGRVRLVSPRLFPDTHAVWRRANRLLLPRLAERLVASAPQRPRVVLNYLPLAASLRLQERLEPDLRIYDCVWDWPNDPYSRPGVVREEEMIHSADLVLTDSPYLHQRMQALHPRVRQLLPAVDYERWAPARRVAGRGTRPRCAYFGGIGVNLELRLVRRLSRQVPLRLIGPVQTDLGELGSGTEVTGPVSYDRLPELLADVDVLVLPYRSDGHTRGVIPAKTFECLATGKPTVAIGLPSLEAFGDLFYLCATEDAFLAAVEAAAEEAPGLRQARLDEACRHDWSARTKQLVETIEAALE